MTPGAPTTSGDGSGGEDGMGWDGTSRGGREGKGRVEESSVLGKDIEHYSSA